MTAPVDSPLPRSILVVDDRAYLAMSGDPIAVTLLEDLESMVIPYSAKPEINRDAVASARDRLRDAGQLSRGALLIKNPYDESVYALAEYAIESFATAKYLALANVSRLLGATHISYDEVTVELSTRAWAADIKAGLKFAVDAETRREVKKKVEASLKGEHKFDGGTPDVEAALLFIQRRNLAADTQITNLVEMRSGKNLIREHKMTINGLVESDASFRSALNLANAGPVKGLGVGASFTRSVESLKRLEITTHITF